MKRITVYPEPRTLKILGQSTPLLNLALDCWARQIVAGAAEVEGLLTKAEWLFLADCLNGHVFAAYEDQASLVLSVHDSHQLDGTGDKWFESEVAEHVEELEAKLRGLSYPAVWAVFLAVQFFWDNHDALDMRSDEWWRASFRTRWNPDQQDQSDVTSGDDPTQHR
jgi:hypothetical protein